MSSKSNEAKIKFSADTGEFDASIKKASSTMSELRSEMRLNQTQMSNTGSSVEMLTRKQEILRQQEEQAAVKVEALNGKYEAAVRIWGENSTEAQKYATQLNGAKAAQEGIKGKIDQTNDAIRKQEQAERESETALSKLNDTIGKQQAEVSKLEGEYKSAVIQYGRTSNEAKALESKLAKANAELSDSKGKMGEADSAARDLAKGLDDAGDSADGASKKFGGIGTAAKAGAVAVGAALVALPASIIGLSQSTEEYQENVNKLQTAFEWSGRTMDDATEVYQNFLGLCGDSDQATEAALDMNNLADAGADVDTWYDIASGAVSAFGDALPVENLIESSNETIRCGKVTGGLADALNWTSINADLLNTKLGSDHPEAMAAFNAALSEGMSTEDAMNEALAACSTEQERQQILTAVLASQYSELGVGYQETSKDLIESRKAQDDWNAKLAEAGEAVRPISTALMELGTQILDDVMPCIEGVASGFSDNLGPAVEFVGDEIIPRAKEGFQWFTDNLPWIAPLVIALATTFGILAVAMNFGTIIGALSGGLTALSGGVTLLSGAMSFLAANPIVLVIAVLAGLAAGVVYLWNTSDEFRAFWIDVWNGVSTAAGEAWTWIDTNLIQPFLAGFQGLCDFLGLLFTDPFAALRLAGEGILSWFDSTFPGLSTTVGTVISDAQTFFNDPYAALVQKTGEAIDFVDARFPGFKQCVGDVVGAAQNFFVDPYGSLKSATTSVLGFMDSNFPGFTSTVSSVVSSVQSFFRDPFAPLRDAVQGIISWWSSNFRLPQIQWPYIPMPHPYISPSGWQIGDILHGVIPSIGVDFYAKGGIMTRPTVFGADGNSLKVGGEAGPEAILPIHLLKGYISEALEQHIDGGGTDRIVSAIEKLANRVTVLEVNDTRFASAMADASDRVNGTRQNLVERGLAL